ncbi:putative oxidoreductase [Sinorhizobium fredii]|nr:INTEGRAL MEMBRANE PROTEIN (Rhomboid family) [Sinorhizobium fredii CCBAU 25509]
MTSFGKLFGRPDRKGRAGWLDRIDGVLAAFAPVSLAQLALRFGLAVPFWRSGMSKWDGFLQLNDTAILLFASEFQLHLPGGPYPFPAPAVVAFAAGSAEVLLPVLLVLGLATRLASLGLLAMTIVIQLTVPDGWPIHVTWAAMALGLIAWGAGTLSIDRWLASPARRAA